MSLSQEGSPAVTPRPAKPSETNRERHREKSEHAESSQTVSLPRRLSGASPRIRFKKPFPSESSGARQFENGKKKRGFESNLKLSRFLKVSHFLKMSHTRAQSFIGAKMNGKHSYSSFPRKKTIEKPSYRRRPVSRGANTNFERHHFQFHRFPFPEAHTKVPESGNAIPHSAISTPSAVNPRTVMRGRESTRFNRLEYGSITAMTGLV